MTRVVLREARCRVDRDHRQDRPGTWPRTHHEVGADQAEESECPYTRDHVVRAYEGRIAPQLRRHAFAGVLQREWHTDRHRGQHDTQQPRVYHHPHLRNGPGRLLAPGVERQRAEQDHGADLEHLDRLAAHGVADDQCECRHGAGGQAGENAGKVFDDGKSEEGGKTQQDIHLGLR